MIQLKRGRLLVPLDAQGERHINFTSREDYFIFLALTGNYQQLADAYEQLTGARLVSTKYRYYRSQNKQARDIMCNTYLTDGTRLLDAIKGKINL